MGGPIPRPVPEGFNPDMSLQAIADQYGVSRTTADRWRRDIGYTGTGGTIGAWTERDVYMLRTNFNAMTYAQLCELLGRTPLAIKSKANSIGLRKLQGNFARDSRAVFHGQRAQGTADMAAQHLRRDAPVFRVDADGKANPKGKCWRFGTIVLTEVEMIAKAERKGWNPHQWKELAA